jgi:hypothetical protein
MTPLHVESKIVKLRSKGYNAVYLGDGGEGDKRDKGQRYKISLMPDE